MGSTRHVSGRAEGGYSTLAPLVVRRPGSFAGPITWGGGRPKPGTIDVIFFLSEIPELEQPAYLRAVLSLLCPQRARCIRASTLSNTR